MLEALCKFTYTPPTFSQFGEKAREPLGADASGQCFSVILGIKVGEVCSIILSPTSFPTHHKPTNNFYHLLPCCSARTSSFSSSPPSFRLSRPSLCRPAPLATSASSTQPSRSTDVLRAVEIPTSVEGALRSSLAAPVTEIRRTAVIPTTAARLRPVLPATVIRRTVVIPTTAARLRPVPPATVIRGTAVILTSAARSRPVLLVTETRASALRLGPLVTGIRIRADVALRSRLAAPATVIPRTAVIRTTAARLRPVLPVTVTRASGLKPELPAAATLRTVGTRPTAVP
ncbi:hypothetical protein B0H11DRAFT_439353 [Mycena galericulata]|nr:hypothetical protein B0H11DRAFT_439353 [Mycena galericulata]